MNTAPEVLRVEDVSLRYGGVQALDGVSVGVAGGSVHGLIGPNGAGKTSLFNVVTGLSRPDSGRVTLRGGDVTRLAPHRRARRGMARTFQRLELFSSLTVLENVLVSAEAAGGLGRHASRTKAVAAAALARAGLTQVAGARVDSLPTGTARLVELARALAGSPSLLLLDEPASGLDETETKTLGEIVTALAREGMAVLLVEHDMALVMRVCDTVDVMDRGRVIAGGPPAEIQASAVVRDAYLGPGADGAGPP